MASLLGANTKLEEIILLTGEMARLAFAPQTISKPKNTQIKMLISGASMLLSEISGNEKTVSALELIAKGIIDLTVKK